MFGRHSEPDVPRALRAGQMFGPRYRLIEVIGQGGMGVVWKAMQLNLERVVAIKVILPEAVSKTDLARFQNEAKLAAALEHHCIVPVYEFDKQDGQYFICLAFIKGPTLEARLKHPISARDAAITVRAIADAVCYAHEKNIIHRDLKPLNILLNEEDAGSPRVTDFGLARRTDVSQHLTAPGNPFGTAYFMSPEQALGETAQIDKPTDVYSLGAMLFFALTRCPPFVNLKIRDEPIAGPRSIVSGVPQELDSICRDCLAIDPNDRISARELTARLDDYLGTVSTLRVVRPAGAVPQDRHVVICGLGDLGMRLAKEGRCRGKSIVAIEQNRDAIREARAVGIEVIEGNATEPAILKRARVDQSEFVIATCQEDRTNFAIAAHIRDILPSTLERRYPLVCRLLLRNYDLRSLVADESFFLAGDSSEKRLPYHINFGDLDLFDTAARRCLRKHQLDFEPIHRTQETIVHLVLAGFGSMGQSLAVQAARIGHFANGVNGDFRLRLTVVDELDQRFEDFRKRYAKIDDICDFRFQPADRSANLVQQLGSISADAVKNHSLVTYATCLETEESPDDDGNFKVGFGLSQLTKGRPAQTLIHQSKSGYDSLFPGVGRGAALSPHVHAFGMKEDIYSWDVLLHESEDQIARALHEDFQQQRRKEGVVDSQNPDWDHLVDRLKDSNRHAADHIPIKLRALDYRIAQLDPEKKPVETFGTDDVRLLAQMEHARWCAELWLAGWSYGPVKQSALKQHPCLLPWNELPPNEQKKDEEQINAIPRILAETGQAICAI
jgi:hypothetical protein